MRDLAEQQRQLSQLQLLQLQLDPAVFILVTASWCREEVLGGLAAPDRP